MEKGEGTGAHVELVRLAASVGRERTDRLDDQDERDAAHQKSIENVADCREARPARGVLERVRFRGLAVQGGAVHE